MEKLFRYLRAVQSGRRRGIRRALARHLLASALVVGLVPAAVASSSLATELAANAPAADADVIALAVQALACERSAGALAKPSTLSVIDYSRPSTQPRLWVFDLARRSLLFEERVAHGRNSGGDLASRFSNAPGSLMSSLGAFVTADTYVGHNGYSLRLQGLEPGFNDNAYERAIVIHGAPYVSDELIRSQGRLGRSFGCPAVRSAVARRLIDTIRDGSFVFAYFPDPAWLERSPLLHDCTGASGVALAVDGAALAHPESAAVAR